jgi:hypothetical protein
VPCIYLYFVPIIIDLPSKTRKRELIFSGGDAMKTNRLPLFVGIILLVALAFAGVVSACENVCGSCGDSCGNCCPPPQGCTPGFWKNHEEAWVGLDPFGVMEINANKLDLNNDNFDDKYIDTLHYKGGNGIEGAQRILLRSYTAAYLNEHKFGDAYYGDYTEIWNAFNSDDRQEMIDLASQLDAANNGICTFPFYN